MGEPDEGRAVAKDSVPEALRQWREAEQTSALARRGRLAAEAAVNAAADAERASQATAEASRRALEAATLAEASASETARAAKLVVLAAQGDAVDASAGVALAEANEGLARHYYGEAVEDAQKRTEPGGS